MNRIVSLGLALLLVTANVSASLESLKSESSNVVLVNDATAVEVQLVEVDDNKRQLSWVLSFFMNVMKPPCPPCREQDKTKCTCDTKPKIHHHAAKKSGGSSSSGSSGSSSSGSSSSGSSSSTSSSSGSSSSTSSSSTSSTSSSSSTSTIAYYAQSSSSNSVYVSGSSTEGWSTTGFSFSGLQCSMCGYTVPASDSRCAGCYLSSSLTTSVSNVDCTTCGTDSSTSTQCGGCFTGSSSGWSTSNYMCSTCGYGSSSTSCSGCSSGLVACNCCDASAGECTGCVSQSDKTTMSVGGLVACSFAVGAAIAAIAVGNRNRPVATSTGHPLHGIVQKRKGLFRSFAKSNFQKPNPAEHDTDYSLA